MTAAALKAETLAGQRLLVVEDEMFVAMLVEDLLRDAGCTVVGPVATVADALKLVEEGGLDGAVLDVNLGSETVYPVAAALQRVAVPYVFVTGYGAAILNDTHRGHPTIQKPFDPRRFTDELLQGLAHGPR